MPKELYHGRDLGARFAARTLTTPLPAYTSRLFVVAQLGWEAELKGLWQIGHGYDPDPRAQARVVYEMYTSDDNDYGCLSSWCAASGCGETIPGIGQDENSKTFQSHRFCRGVWTGDPSLFLRAGIALGGPSYLKVIGKECQRAKWRHRNPSPSTSHGHGHGRGRQKGKP